MEILSIFLPLAAALIAGFFGRAIGDRGAEVITCGAMLIAAVCSVLLFNDIVFKQTPRVLELFTWISSGDMEVKWALRLDQLTAVMLVVVNVVSACVHVYSVGYMSEDTSRARFMAYLSFFTFAMLMLVTANNFLQLFFGWEGVGVASYLLIGFWNKKDSANAAAIKAFVVNRVGDFGLALGMMAVFMIFGSLHFDTVFAMAESKATETFMVFGQPLHAITVACLLLFVGAMGKSAQLGLHTWLPDAMEGPTPVSALIHAATMVTAGVFLVARLSPLFEYAPDALMFVTVIGALTAFVAATIGMAQTDIKRVIAYSTMSQLGYMFFALGVSAYGAAVFHLFTHAFFKALLFLGAGSVIHAMSGEQDMRKMGGIWRKIPVTYSLMWIGSLALAGLPLFAGYYSKDMILEAAYADHTWFGDMAFRLGIAAALMTAFYSWRLLFMTFHGAPRADKKTMSHVHESPGVMLMPLLVLAAGALLAGYFFHDFFIGDQRFKFWGESLFVFFDNDTVAAAHHVPHWVALLPIGVALAGIALAWISYIAFPALPDKCAARLKALHALLLNKWYFDVIYDRLIVRTIKGLAFDLWKTGDGQLIDGYGPDGVARTVSDGGERVQGLQSGYVFHYAFAILLGVVLLVFWFMFNESAVPGGA